MNYVGGQVKMTYYPTCAIVKPFIFKSVRITKNERREIDKDWKYM